MRDELKGKEYFDSLIEELYDDINFYNDKLRKKEVASDRIPSVKWNMRKAYLQVLIAKYSSGYDIDEIRKDFLDLIPMLVDTWSDGDSVITMYWIYSFAILLGIGNDHILQLEKIISDFNIHDALLTFFRVFVFEKKVLITDDFVPKLPYPLLKNIIISDNKKELLEEYIKKEWYKGSANKCQYWYNSHKENMNLYFGYWSFEAGAVAKILGIDDSGLKNVPYYPYDLVHYCNKKA